MSRETDRFQILKAAEGESDVEGESVAESIHVGIGAVEQLEELGALAELLQKNTGGLTKASAQALGNSIARALTTIDAEIIHDEDEEPSEAGGIR